MEHLGIDFRFLGMDLYTNYRIVKGGVPRGGGSLIFPKVPQLPPPPLEQPPVRNPEAEGFC